LKLPTVLQFVYFKTMPLPKSYGKNVILLVQVLVKAVGVLKVISTEVTVFSVTPCSSADAA
jgi:hypothetical protein